jgi:hypothetical protein
MSIPPSVWNYRAAEPVLPPERQVRCSTNLSGHLGPDRFRETSGWRRKSVNASRAYSTTFAIARRNTSITASHRCLATHEKLLCAGDRQKRQQNRKVQKDHAAARWTSPTPNLRISCDAFNLMCHIVLQSGSAWGKSLSEKRNLHASTFSRCAQPATTREARIFCSPSSRVRRPFWRCTTTV